MPSHNLLHCAGFSGVIFIHVLMLSTVSACPGGWQMAHVRIWGLADSHKMELSDCDHLVVCTMPIHVIHMAHYRLYRLSTRERSHAI